MGFEPMTSAILVRCSTNWAMKPHIGSEVNLLSSYLPVRSEMTWSLYEIIHIWTAYQLHIISLLTGRYELNKLTSLPMCGFIAQLVEHRTVIAEVTGLNPVEVLIFSGFFFSNCLNWKINCDDHSSLSNPLFVGVFGVAVCSLQCYCEPVA